MKRKLYIWGTGVILGRVLDYRLDRKDIIAFIDNDISKKEYMGIKVIQPTEITGMYDAIIVANSHTKEIYNQCKELNINLEKVIFLYNNFRLVDYNQNYDFIASIVGKDYSNIISQKYHLIRSVAIDEIEPLKEEYSFDDKMFEEDYVRVRDFYLIVDEIKRKNIQGSVAELGVYKGEFSKYINASFPDRKMYLFDTFEGFEESEADKEKNKGNCNDAFIKAVNNTSESLVLSKMKYKDNIIIKKGVFPESINGLDEQFAFVSLDVDFEDSTFAGLEYFYPRLSKGGYMFIHDYNYGYFDCVKKAVDRYENKFDLSLCKFPICDADGTLIITK